MFVDEVTMSLKAGKGGDGCLSFRREKYEPKGGPNGGNGGQGGNIVLWGDENSSDLTDYKFVPHAKADDGESGRGSDQHGANGKDKRLRLPLGTVVYNENGVPVCELTEHGKEIVLLEGGRGGLGNSAFKSSVNQTPRRITPGTYGEEGEFKLILKTMADLGLVGFPNAGKSSLMGLLTNRNAKVGHYPFTTVNPGVGVIEFPDTFERLTLADVPGLIEGAHENRGLGLRFLRHLERCKALCFMLDISGEEDRDPLKDFRILLDELANYDEAMPQKKRVVVANKMDEVNAAENFARFTEAFPEEKVYALSCLSEDGLSEVKDALRDLVLRKTPA